jgi:hypothetical protein
MVKCLQDARIALGGHVRRGIDRGIPEIEVLDLAERGLLLSYVLSVNGTPCGLASGTRFRDTLVMHSFSHDTQIGHLSPGTVLQTLMMKDVVEHKLARRIDYGFGEPRYRLTNDLDERVTAIVLRRGWMNQSFLSAHQSYVRLLNGVKYLVRSGYRAAGGAGADEVQPAARGMIASYAPQCATKCLGECRAEKAESLKRLDSSGTRPSEG